MNAALITSASNATLKRMRSLREKKYRRAEGLFDVETMLDQYLRVLAPER